jgi:hypothetical protein
MKPGTGLDGQPLIKQAANDFEIAGQRLWRSLGARRTQPRALTLQIDNTVARFFFLAQSG